MVTYATELRLSMRRGRGCAWFFRPQRGYRPHIDTDDELSEMEALPKSVLISAAEYALSESNKERGISNDNVESVISKRRGFNILFGTV